MGKFGKALSLDGVDDYAEVSNSENYDDIYLRIFLDGNLDKETTENVDGLDTFSTITYIENSPAGDRTFGTIDEVRIYNKALDEEEIKSLYLYYQNFEVRPCILCLRPTI